MELGNLLYFVGSSMTTLETAPGRSIKLGVDYGMESMFAVTYEGFQPQVVITDRQTIFQLILANCDVENKRVEWVLESLINCVDPASVDADFH